MYKNSHLKKVVGVQQTYRRVSKAVQQALAEIKKTIKIIVNLVETYASDSIDSTDEVHLVSGNCRSEKFLEHHADLNCFHKNTSPALTSVNLETFDLPTKETINFTINETTNITSNATSELNGTETVD